MSGCSSRNGGVSTPDHSYLSDSKSCSAASNSLSKPPRKPYNPFEDDDDSDNEEGIEVDERSRLENERGGLGDAGENEITDDAEMFVLARSRCSLNTCDDT